MWFVGTVLDINAITKEFHVKYNGEEDNCCFPLLDHITSGDLEVP